MKYSISELKAKGKQQIKGYVWLFLGLYLVTSLIIAVSESIVIGPILLSGAIELGLTKFFMELMRDGKTEFNTGFTGFDRFVDTLVAELMKTIFIALWTLLFVIPGIIAAFRYSMVFYILADNPKMSGYAALQKSKEMMHGHKGELFGLELSFIGWYLLCIVTFGLAAIYVAPYVYATRTNFYQMLKEQSEPVAAITDGEAVPSRNCFSAASTARAIICFSLASGV